MRTRSSRRGTAGGVATTSPAGRPHPATWPLDTASVQTPPNGAASGGERRARRRTPAVAAAGLIALVVLVAAGATGYALGSSSGSGASASPYLDDEYTYLGALRSWPAEPNSTRTNPFRGFAETDLVLRGRTVCARAGDSGMHFDGMLHLLRLDPHQTFVVITEAIDKLCTSQRRYLSRLTS